jgi:hypothetical protein
MRRLFFHDAPKAQSVPMGGLIALGSSTCEGGGKRRDLFIARLVDLERQRCAFLKFQITVEAGRQPILLEITGRLRRKRFVATYSAHERGGH